MGEPTGRYNGCSFHPPARLVIIHETLLFGVDAINVFSESLSNVTALALSLSGASRIPFLGVLSTAASSTVVYPLQHLRASSFPKLQASLERIKSSVLHTLSNNQHLTLTEVFKSVLTEALSQHHEQTTTFHQLVGYLPQLEILVITPLQPQVALESLNKAAHSVDLQMVKNIQLVCIAKESSDVEASNSDLSDAASTSEVDAPSSMSASDVIDTVSIAPDSMQFENLFKQWLQDDSTEREHIHIHLPDDSSSSGAAQTLKCDIIERMLPPSQLPSASQFCLHTLTSYTGKAQQSAPRSSTSSLQLSKTAKSSHNSGQQSDQPWPYHLKALATVKATGICDSVVFGTPLLLRPTACWKLDWEELDYNQRRFHVLVQLLSDQNDALILGKDILPVSTAGGSSRPMAHFVAMACQTNSALLLRPIAIGDLLLPTDSSVALDGPVRPEDIDTMRSSLQKLECLDAYNPLLMPGFLMKALASGLAKSHSSESGKTQLVAGKKRKPIQRPVQAAPASKKANRETGHDNTESNRLVFKPPSSTASYSPYGSKAPTARHRLGQRYGAVAVTWAPETNPSSKNDN